MSLQWIVYWLESLHTFCPPLSRIDSPKYINTKTYFCTWTVHSGAIKSGPWLIMFNHLNVISIMQKAKSSCENHPIHWFSTGYMKSAKLQVEQTSNRSHYFLSIARTAGLRFSQNQWMEMNQSNVAVILPIIRPSNVFIHRFCIMLIRSLLIRKYSILFYFHKTARHVKWWPSNDILRKLMVPKKEKTWKSGSDQ